MDRILRYFGSLHMAVPLLVAIAAVLGWGTLYEARFGTAAVQQTVYRAWWFQALLGFLAVNLAAAALSRYPWQRRHLPFVAAHLGLILILLGGILGGRWGIEGQLIIPEGRAERVLQLPQRILVVREENPGVDHVFPTRFDARAWVQEPHVTFQVPLEAGPVRLTVDRYFPDAAVEERVTDDGPSENPAIRLRVGQREASDAIWLFARDPERFGAAWQNAHVLFIEPDTPEQAARLLGGPASSETDRGTLRLEFTEPRLAREIPVPRALGEAVDIEGTPYRLIFKDYFADFAMTDHGVVSQSDLPHNPAVSFLLVGPAGADVHLVFARYPEFAVSHGVQHTIPVTVRYLHSRLSQFPPHSIGIVRIPDGALAAVMTGGAGERTILQPLELGRRHPHPWMDAWVEVEASYPQARVQQVFSNRSQAVRREALHVVGSDGAATAEAWLTSERQARLVLGGKPLQVEYRAARRELPVAIKLLDFRKMDYPGTEMAAGFESDVELADPQRGIILMRTIRMNAPLRYRGFSFYQSSYLPGPVETTVLSVRNDPGTPLVYAGFLIVIGGVIGMFLLRKPEERAA